MKTKIHLLLVLSGFCFSTQLYAQGVSRAQGVGWRVNFWNITGGRTSVNYDTDWGETNVDLSGIGPSFYYFSRAYRDVFLEMSLGIISGGKIDTQDYGTSDQIRVESLVPFLVGLRYDFLSSRVSGALHPYASLGAGPYTAFEVESKNSFSPDGEPVEGGQGSVSTRMEYGWYFGGGVNFVLTSWFAVNADLKYNRINIPEIKNYSGLALGIGTVFMWGKRKSIYEIRNVQVVLDEIYPVRYLSYGDFPIVLVSVQNLVGHPIEVSIRGQIQGFSDRAKDSGFVRIDGGQTEEVPVSVYFGRQLWENEHNDTAILEMDVEVRAATTHRQELSAELVIRGRNAWNGEMEMLPRFLTPEDEFIRELARGQILNLTEPIEPGLVPFTYARVLFEKLTSLDLKYLSDPNIPFYKDDRVQFAKQTVDAGSGDCDDLVVLYASLLESIGIRTAFVEVRDPDKALAHLFLLFDTGLTADEAYLISENEKRYIVRENPSGQRMVWIPVETTLVEGGFEAAWNSAAMTWLQESQLRHGLTEEWVRIIDNY